MFYALTECVFLVIVRFELPYGKILPESKYSFLTAQFLKLPKQLAAIKDPITLSIKYWIL